ncbi:MAG: hypothetical protein FD153_1900, partial [Rhodospirillaceae bacterium]
MSDSSTSRCNQVRKGWHGPRERLRGLVLVAILGLAGGVVTMDTSTLRAQILEHRSVPLVPAGSDPQPATAGAAAKDSGVGAPRRLLPFDPAESTPLESTVVIGEGQPAAEVREPADAPMTPDGAVLIYPQPLLAPEEQVEMEPLATVDPDDIGVLGPGESGF